MTSSKTWQQQLSSDWEKQPVVLQEVFNGQASEAHLFDALCRANQCLQHADARVEFCIWVDGRQVAPDHETLPQASDGDISAFLKRFESQVGSSEFTILLANPHLYSDSLWQAARKLSNSVADEMGMTNGGVDTSVFLGKYTQTPFGVHRGQMSVLTVPIIGSKKFLLWDYEYGSVHTDIQDSLEFEKHREHALVRVAVPGSLMYWPSDFWHIAEGDGSATAAWNIGFWKDRPSRSVLLGALDTALCALDQLSLESASSVPWGVSVENKIDLGWQLDRELENLKMVTQDSILEDALLMDRMRFLSADGYRDVPTQTKFQSSLGADCQLRACTPIHYSLLTNDQLCIAVNGHMKLFAEPNDSVLLALKKLNRGQAVLGTELQCNDLLEYLIECGSLGAVT